MSLVFLKNATNNGGDEHMQPYSWSNNFDTPLVLPPDSQVAYISSTMQREKTIILTDEDHLWFQIGNEQLNIPMPMFFTSPGGVQETWGDVANRVKGNEYVGISDYMYDGQTGGYNATYNGATDQFQISISQRLQPTLKFVWANIGSNLPATWGGFNQTGTFGTDPVVNPLGNVIQLQALVPGAGAGNLWNCGWGQCDLVAGGKGVGDLQDFGEDNFSMCRSQTGIKRSVYDAVTSVEDLGGALQVRGSNNPGTPGATATSQCVPYMCGLNSVQAIQIADAEGSGGFLNNTSINGGFGATGSVLSPNVVQVRITDDQDIVVEIMDTAPVQQDFANLNFGAWGNVEEAVGISTGLLEVERIKITTWLADTLSQPQNTGGETSQPYNAVGNTNETRIVFQIKWTTPYTFQVWAGTGFDEETGKYAGRAVAGSNYPVGTAYADTYTIIYDSRTGGTFNNALAPEVEKTMVVPQFFGDLGMCIYQDRRNRINWRGNFDVIKCYADAPVAPYPTYDIMLRGIDGINFSQPTTTYPNAYHLEVYRQDNIFPALTGALLDEFNNGAPPPAGNLPVSKGYSDCIMSCVSGILTNAGGHVSDYQRWYPIPKTDLDVNLTFGPSGTRPQVETGVLIGLIKPGDDGHTDATFVLPGDIRNQTYIPVAKTGETDAVQSVHIQLTNLPINGRNGVTSTKTSTIAVVHNAKGSLNVGTTRVFETYQPEKNFIDLNNVAEMTLNQLRVYVSDDANKPATFLNGKSDLVVMFRQKPAADRGISTQPINKFGLTPSMGATTIKM